VFIKVRLVGPVLDEQALKTSGGEPDQELDGFVRDVPAAVPHSGRHAYNIAGDERRDIGSEKELKSSSSDDKQSSMQSTGRSWTPFAQRQCWWSSLSQASTQPSGHLPRSRFTISSCRLIQTVPDTPRSRRTRNQSGWRSGVEGKPRPLTPIAGSAAVMTRSHPARARWRRSADRRSR
jgi:hypothetical protein